MNPKGIKVPILESRAFLVSVQSISKAEMNETLREQDALLNDNDISDGVMTGSRKVGRSTGVARED